MAQKKHSRKAAIGVGLALAAASVAAAYFLTGKDGARRRKQIKGWMVKARGEVLEKMEQAKDMNEELYGQIVKEVSRRYRGMKQIDPKDLQTFGKEMQGYWRNIKKHLPAKPKTKSKKS